MSDQPETKELVFASTKEYRLFGEFCDTRRKYGDLAGLRPHTGDPVRYADVFTAIDDVNTLQHI